ncbi:DUF6193 family natural product biosynthesis protein [Kitasatospora sp. NPDC101183]|uniref:DUF6193 family natural product biosynthesis protein n=1 Tax=Kitasatospora sp. NPDC101183 TaxID=3364100 RepID=UPI003817504F
MNSGAGQGRRYWDEDGALAAAMRETAEGLGLVLPEHDGRWGRLAEYADEESGRRATVSPPGSGRRTFQVRLHGLRAPLASGGTSDLARAARATAAWMGGEGLGTTKARAPFIRFRPWALEHEREPFDAVELAWRIKLDRVHTAPYSRHPRVHALHEAAYAEPVLRALMPVNSHYNLWFSTAEKSDEYSKKKVGYTLVPYDEGLYGAGEGLYGVWNRSEVVARCETPEEAAALVVASILNPPGAEEG